MIMLKGLAQEGRGERTNETTHTQLLYFLMMTTAL